MHIFSIYFYNVLNLFCSIYETLIRSCNKHSQFISYDMHLKTIDIFLLSIINSNLVTLMRIMHKNLMIAIYCFNVKYFLNEGVLRSLFFLHLLLLLLLYRFARNEFSVYQYTKMCRYIRLLEMRDLDQIKRYNLMSIYTPYFAIFLFIKKV